MKILLLLLLLATIHTAYGQSIKQKNILEKEDYLMKSEKQKKFSLAAGATGIGLMLIGLIIDVSEFGNGMDFTGESRSDEKFAKFGETLMIVGSGVALASIPLRNAHKRNQKMAAALSINNKRVVHPPLANKAFPFAPTVSLKISLAQH